ncbi:MAG: hypothetical protein Q4C83_01115 [Candidatus Saccharibacteria bacterium]|nr:hypothetical protein [Candidatus Saccharibacteria bacterium]
MIFKPSKHDRATFGKIASEYNLTYYGTIIPSEADDYTPVRGMTASPEQIDDNYTAGIVAGFNVQLLQRNHDVYITNNRKANRTWTIVQIDLAGFRVPHLIIGSNSKPSGDDLTLASYLRMYEIDLASLNTTIADDFANKFAVYVSPQKIQSVASLFTPELQAMLSIHFADYDFEIDGDKLYVYTTKLPLVLTDLDKQLRIAIWLAKLVVKVL